jgi:signal transduction protein with GAF and PtsI domain
MAEYQSEHYDICGGFEQARDLTATLNLLVRSIAEIMGVKASSIRLLDERTQSLRVAAAYGLSKSYIDKGPLQLSEGSVEIEILKGRIVSTPDVSKEPGAVFREEAEREGIKSILNVPLTAGTRAIGIVRVYTSEQHEFTEEETARLASLSAFGGIIVDRARLSDRMRALVCIARSVNSTLSLNDVLQMITENAISTLGMRASSIRLLDKDRRTLEVRAASGLSSSYLAKGPVEVDKSPLDQECLAGKCITMSDISTDARLQYPEEIREEGIRSMLTVPLKIRGRSIGVLRIYASKPHDFSEPEIEFLTALASFGAIAIENARLFEHVKTEYEELTRDVWKWYDWGSRFPNI